MKQILTIIMFSFNYECKNRNVRSINCSVNMRNLCVGILDWGGLGNCTKECCKWILTNLHKFLDSLEIKLLANPYTSYMGNNVFLFCNDIATLLSIEIASLIHVFFLSKYWPNLSQVYVIVLWGKLSYERWAMSGEQ